MVQDPSKYDGTPSIQAAKVKNFFASVTGSPTTGELISAENIQYIIKAHYADTSGNLDPNAAEEKNVNGEITLTDPNYVFYDSHSEGREFTFGMGGKITKAPAPTVQAGALTVANGHAAEYTFDFKSLPPALKAPRTYDKITYTLGTISLGGYYADGDGAAVIDGVLTLPIRAVNPNAEKPVGTVTVTTTNYEDFCSTASATISSA